jgi:hypothetical protein
VNGSSVSYSFSLDHLLLSGVTDLLLQGRNTFFVSCSDTYGNTSSSSFMLFVDTTAPVISLISTFAGDTIDNFRQEIRFLISDSHSGINHLSALLSLNEAIYETDELVIIGDTVFFSPSVNYLADNSCSFSVSDNAGECPNTALYSFSFHAIPKTFEYTILSPLDGFVTACDSVRVSISVDSPSDFIIPSPVVFVNDRSVGFDEFIVEENLVSFSISSEFLSNGSNTLLFTGVSDIYGNLYSDTITLSITYDREDPLITLLTDIPSNAPESLTMVFVISDNTSPDYSSINIRSASSFHHELRADTLCLTFVERIADSVSFEISISDIAECPNTVTINISYLVEHPVYYVVNEFPLDNTVSHLVQQPFTFIVKTENPEAVSLIIDDVHINYTQMIYNPITLRFYFTPWDDLLSEVRHECRIISDESSYSFSFTSDFSPPSISSFNPEKDSDLSVLPERITVFCRDNLSYCDFSRTIVSINGVIQDDFIVNNEAGSLTIKADYSNLIELCCLSDQIPDYGEQNISETFYWFYRFVGKGFLEPEQRVITPNMDGINDFAEFYLMTKGSVHIYSVSGEKIQTISGDGKLLWNGLNEKGNPVSPGLYVFIIETQSGVVYKGSIAVAR